MPTHPVTQDTMSSNQISIQAALLEATADLESADALQKNLPDWLLKASPTSLSGLDQTAQALQLHRAKLESILNDLLPLKKFCSEKLSAALAKKWPVNFDVERDHLELPGEECGCPAIPSTNGGEPQFPLATRSLLDAAMQNFSAGEAMADGFPAGSLVKVQSVPAGVVGLSPAAFVQLCRELDLGRLYQQHFATVFGLQISGGTVLADTPLTRDIKQMKKLLLLLDTQLAYMKGDISPAGEATLQRLIDADGVVSVQSLQYQGRPLIMQGIEIHGSCIWGVTVFSARSIQFYPQEWCLVYMPGEPHRPLYEYPSFNAFKEYLTLKLNVRSYKNYFANCLDEDNKFDFMGTFASTRKLGFIKALPITVSCLDFMVQSHVGKLQIDSRTLVVPTADVDEEVRKSRLLNYLEVGVSVATLAGLFVPVVGQLMMGVAVGQLLAEVCEGVEDWRQGDKDEALAHLLDIAQNIAMMGVLAAGQQVVGSVVRRTLRQHPEFFKSFTAIFTRDGQPRLWKPELEGYQLQASAADEVVAEADGVFQKEGQSCVRLDQHEYAVKFDPTSKAWHITHPSRSNAFAPKLTRHPEGGWRLVDEQPEDWAAAYALKRIDPRLVTLDDASLEKSLRITGTSVGELQRLSVENLPLPPRLKDLLERLRLEQKLRRYITVSETQLARGELLQTVVDGLYAREVHDLLGVKAARADETTLLAKRLSAAVKGDRRPLLEHFYRAYDQSSSQDVEMLRRAVPDVPSRQAQALFDRATSVERRHLRATGRVPMRLAQQMREGGQDVRLDRAFAGWMLPQLSTADSEKLTIQLLPRLHGWHPDLRLELRDGTVRGRLLEAIGAETAGPALRCTLVRSSQGYEAFDGGGQSLSGIAVGPEGLFTAILRAIPSRQRIALGFTDPDISESARLRRALLDVALDTREDAAQLLASGKVDKAVTRENCMQGDSPNGSSTHPRALMRKVARLYPALSEAQANSIVDGLGDDHLSRAKAVKQLQQKFKQLRNALDGWAEDESAMKTLGGNLSEVRESRRLAADLVEDSWRRITLARGENGIDEPALDLNGMRVGKLPILPADLTFDHVKQLSLKNMDLDNDVAYFLKAFKQVESLELDRNRISQLPEVISHMPALKRLSLSNNQLKFTEQTLRKLADLRTLRALNLGDNPLGATPDVGKMFDLRYLSVRETRATELPRGLERLPNLDRVDLRDNDIRELPDWLFSSPRRFSETINLRHNPLTAASNDRLKQYRDSVGSGMGYIEDDITRLNEQAARAIWLPEGAGETFARRNAIWVALRDDAQADGLFRLLSELVHTADSAHVQDDLKRRVWNVLNACESNSALREQLLELAANPINCTDSAAMNFSHLEVAVEIARVTHPHAGSPSRLTSLLKLGQGLFRLDQLEQIARVHVRDNPAVDPLEVHLAYRTGLAEHFELPGQPRHMRYASLSGVTASALETAKRQVLTAELSPLLLKFLVRQPFWSDHLKQEYPRQFSALSETYSTKMDVVFDQAGKLTTANYLTQLDMIRVARETAENAVLESLTEEVLRISALGLCAIPSG